MAVAILFGISEFTSVHAVGFGLPVMKSLRRRVKMGFAIWKSHKALCDEDNFKINQSMHFGSLRTAAVTLYGELGAWIYDEWQTLNQKYFEKQNTAGPMLWGITPYSGSWGYWLSDPGLIFMHTSLVIPSNIEGPAWGIT